MNDDKIKVDIYTDPLCCWSYAFEKPWSRFIDEYGEMISYGYVMCGMIPGWKSYKDPMNVISKPSQMGPLWMYAAEVAETEMMFSIWNDDPPESSFPACIAVKTAGLQSLEAEEAYLRGLTHALMKEGQNIAKKSVLLEVAKRVSINSFSIQKFQADLETGAGRERFKSDLVKAKLHSIGRYPTLTFQSNGKIFTMVGYRPYEALRDTFEEAISTFKVGAE